MMPIGSSSSESLYSDADVSESSGLSSSTKSSVTDTVHNEEGKKKKDTEEDVHDIQQTKQEGEDGHENCQFGDFTNPWNFFLK